MDNPVSPADALRRSPGIPQDVESEMALLGAMIVNQDCVGPVLKAGVERGIFSVPLHGEILQGIVRVHEGGRPLDLLTLRDELRGADRLQAVGGADYLYALAQGVPGTSPESAVAYAQIVLETARRRAAVLAARRFADAAARGDVNGEALRLREALEDVERGVKAGRRTSKPKSIEDLRALAVEQAHVEKIPTGLPGVDEALKGGVQAGQFLTIGAFSGQGKTTVCVHQATHKAALGHPTMYLTAELSEVEAGARVEATSQDPFEMFPNLRVWYPEGDIYDVVREIADWAEPHHGAARCPVVVIDYLQRLRPPSGIENRERQVAVVCEELQSLGRRKGILFVLAAQLNRKSQEDVPQLHHFRESGLIEQMSDVALLVAKTGENAMRVLVAKNRWGTSGQEIDLNADFARCQFGELSPELRYADLAEAVRAFLKGEKAQKAKVREVSMGIKWGPKGHPSKADLQAAGAACGGFAVFGSEVALIVAREA